MKRVLAIVPEIPAPIGGGGPARSWHVLKAVAASCDLTLCILAETSNGKMDASSFGGPVRIIQAEPAPRSAAAGSVVEKIRRVLGLIFFPWKDGGTELIFTVQSRHSLSSTAGAKWGSSTSLWLLRLWVRILHRLKPLWPWAVLIRRRNWSSLKEAVETAYREVSPDVIWLEYSYLSPLLESMIEKFPRARILCNAHNVEHQLLKSIQARSKGQLRNWQGLEAELMKDWETWLVGKVDTLLVCSDADGVRFLELDKTFKGSLELVPNGVDTSYFHCAPPSTGQPPILLFPGTAGYPPNDDAVEWMIREIFPLIRNEVPECRLVLAGRAAAVHWSCWKGIPGVEVVSDVPDMRPWLRDASICVVPLRSGSGTRLKILEAMSCGRAVVSTSTGAEGIEAQPGRDLLIADEPADFAKAVIRLLESSAERHAAELAGRALVSSRYAWNEITNRGVPELLPGVQAIKC